MILAAMASVASPPAFAEDCPICARSVVTNRDLAGCFRMKYGDPQALAAPTVAVDLSGCSRAKGIVQAIPTPGRRDQAPDLRFLLTRAQVECLLDRLDDPDLVLDPAARIDLGGCG
jgi:hypothetical protein